MDFDFVRENLKPFYSDTGRPSIDPERLLRILLIGYLYGVTSERKLIEELRMHLAWRWFTGLTFDQEVPHHSTFSKNRHGRFQESQIFEQLFQEIVERCVACGLVQGDHLSVDGSFIQADASSASRIPREQLSEIARVNRNVRQYLDAWMTCNKRICLSQNHISKAKCQPRIPTQHISAKATRLPHLDTSTTILWITQVA